MLVGVIPDPNHSVNWQVLKQIDSPIDDTVPAIRPITVRDLLTEGMGIGAVMAPPSKYPIQKAMT